MKIRRILCWLLSLALLTGSIYTADTLVRQRRLARKTVRLHVIANSDEAADQAQKLRVRDGVLACVSGLTADCETADDARKCIAAHLPEIAEAAQRVLAGSGYDVTVSLGPETYGTRTMPAFSACRDIPLAAGADRAKPPEKTGGASCSRRSARPQRATKQSCGLLQAASTRMRPRGSRRSSRNTACASKRSSGSRSSRNCFHEPAHAVIRRGLSLSKKSCWTFSPSCYQKLAKSIFAA